MNIFSEIFPTDGSNSSDYFFYNCTEVEKNFSMIPVLFISLLLGFPINSYVIWLIVKGKGNGLAAEFFNLNLAICEIILCEESVFVLLSYEFKNLWNVVSFLDGLASGCPLFQCLMCVERYLAVVHPVTFLKYKPLRYRVTCSVIVWMASFGLSGISNYFFILQPMLYFFLLLAQFFIFLSIQLFCLVAVLRALKQSGPGERGRERQEENQMKRRAFYLILITTMTMVILYAPCIILMAIGSLDSTNTFFLISLVFFTVAGLVQPLLFLYRVRKLPFIKYQ